MGVRDHIFFPDVLRPPLLGSGWTLDQLPLVAEEHIEIAVVPCRRFWLPGAFDTTGGGVLALSCAEPVDPAQTLRYDGRTFGFRTDQRRVARAVRLAESVSAGDERDGLF